MRFSPAACLILLCSCLGAADAPSRAEADGILAQAMAAMQEATTTSSRAIDAALGFNQVLAIDEALGDTDGVCEMQANIYWCKKHMTLSELNTYLARKTAAGDHATSGTASIAAADDKSVSAEAAETYYNRAVQYAADHPDRHLQIAIRFFEVADRFQGTPFSIKAQRLSLDAEHQHLQSLQQGHEQADTLFSRRADAVPDSARQPVPASDALKTATATIRTTFKDDFAKTRRKQKLALVASLLTQAEQTKDDALMRFAVLEQARDLAIAIGDPAGILAAIDQLAAHYVGIDALAAKKAALAKVRGLPAAGAMITLLDKPADPEANTVAGRFFAVELQQWPLALPMLAQGADAQWKKAAAMELAKPASPAQQAELADGWYDLAKKLPDANRDPLYARALTWYKQAVGGLEGMSKKTVEKRIADLGGLILMEGVTDWANLTAAQWERVHSPVFAVAMNKRNEVPADALPAPSYRVLASPTDTWHVMGLNLDDPVTHQGDPVRMAAGFHAGEMLMTQGGGMPERLGTVSHPGILILSAATTAPTIGGGGRRGRGGLGGGAGGEFYTSGAGSIRVKFLAIDED